MSAEQVIGVVGAGTMGAGIAYTAAVHGYQVRLTDAAPGAVDKGIAGLREMAEKRVTQHKMSRRQCDEIFAALHPAATLAELRDADVVIEAILEDARAKQNLFVELERVCTPRAVLASNTSSIPITTLAEPLKHANRFIGMHFFNPAPVMPLVELIAGERTDHQTVVSAVAVARAMEKTPVKAKDRPGFIANRVARPFYLESLAMLERGIADISTIDAALRSAGFPMGPFELLDLIGLDVNLAVTKSVYGGFANAPRFAPNAIQEKLVAEGRLGRKSGRGFYDYANPSAPTAALAMSVRGLPDGALQAAPFMAFCRELGRPADAASWIHARVISAVINEGATTVGEKTALARDVDLAMTLGLRYPEGPMSLADRVGLDVVLELLSCFGNDSPSGRHAAAALLTDTVSAGKLGEKTAVGFLVHSL